MLLNFVIPTQRITESYHVFSLKVKTESRDEPGNTNRTTSEQISHNLTFLIPGKYILAELF